MVIHKDLTDAWRSKAKIVLGQEPLAYEREALKDEEKKIGNGW